MKESFRWYGPDDPVSLNNISQIGAKNVVSALHQIPNGLVWNKDDIKEHQQNIRNAGLDWEVVESVPVHEDIKQRTGSFQTYICLLYTSPSPRDRQKSRMPSSA